MSKNKNIYSNASNRIAVFTDGSSDPASGKGSWAGIILCNDKKNVISGMKEDSSQHKMELFAVLECFRFIEKKCQIPETISIYTDSEYVQKLPSRREKLEKNSFITQKGKPVVYNALIKELYAYLDKYPVELIRVPGHQKKGSSEISDYNREVDKLSRKILRKEIRDS